MNRDRSLTEEEGRTLLRIARDALTVWLEGGELPALEGYALTELLREPRGAFVTLRRGGELRGCIGHIMHQYPLAQSVRDNAIAAGTRDYRFMPVTLDELPRLSFEVTVLGLGERPDTPFIRVQDVQEIVVGRDGLYIEREGARGGLLLPQVAVEQGWDAQTFLSAVCRKAGYPDRAWEDPEVRLYRFTAQAASEEDAGAGDRGRSGS